MNVSEVRKPHHLKPARPTEGASAAKPCPGPMDTISISAEVPGVDRANVDDRAVPARPATLGQPDDGDSFSGMSLAPSSGAEWLVSLLDSLPRPTQTDVEKVLRLVTRMKINEPDSLWTHPDPLVSKVDINRRRPQGAEPLESLHWRTFDGDVDQQAQQLANYAAAVRGDDTQFAGALQEAFKQKLQDGEEVVWKLHEQKFGKLTVIDLGEP